MVKITGICARCGKVVERDVIDRYRDSKESWRFFCTWKCYINRGNKVDKPGEEPD